MKPNLMKGHYERKGPSLTKTRQNSDETLTNDYISLPLWSSTSRPKLEREEDGTLDKR